MPKYIFIKDWHDPGAHKQHVTGSVVRMSPTNANPLKEQGILLDMPDDAMCRKNVTAPNSCAAVPLEVHEAYSQAMATTATESKSKRIKKEIS